MARKQLDKTLADYLAIAVTPVLIMLLVGSLVFFLQELFSSSVRYESRVRWILFWFVFGMVLISRIAIESGRAQSGLFTAGLAGATALAIFRFAPEGPWMPIACLAVIWWCTDKLTWDCTLIDESEDASGEGLLQVAGVDDGSELTQPDSLEAAGAGLPEEAAMSDDEGRRAPLWKRLFLNVSEREGRPHAPGLWVVYFSLAALPIFGFGQTMIPAEQAGSRSFAFQLLLVYVAAGLGLLLLTSFLGLRRYLRQRQLQMPTTMAATWVGMGATIAIGILIVALLIPRPQGEYTVVDLIDRAGDELQEAADVAFLNDGGGRGPGQRSGPASRDTDQGQADSPDLQGRPGGRQQGSQSDGNAQPSDQGAPDPQSPGQGQASGPSPQQQSGDSPQQQTGSFQQQSGESQQQSGSPPPGDQQGGQQTPSDPQAGDPSSGTQQQSSDRQPGGRQSDPERSAKRESDSASSQEQREAQNQNGAAGNKQRAPAGESSQNQSSQRQPSQDAPARGDSSQGDSSQGETAQGETAQGEAEGEQPQTPEAAPPESTPPALSEALESVGDLFKWVMYGLLVLGGLWMLYCYRESIAAFAARLWNELLSLFGRRSPEPVETVEETVVPEVPPQPFAAFENPFASGAASRHAPSELVRYTFEALQAWGFEHGCPRSPDQTPMEYGQQLRRAQLPIASEAGDLSQLYARVAYASFRPQPDHLVLLETLWRKMGRGSAS